MNRKNVDFIDELILSAAQAQCDKLANRCFDKAEGAADALLNEGAMSSALHQLITAQIKGTRKARFPGANFPAGGY